MTTGEGINLPKILASKKSLVDIQSVLFEIEICCALVRRSKNPTKSMDFWFILKRGSSLAS